MSHLNRRQWLQVLPVVGVGLVLPRSVRAAESVLAVPRRQVGEAAKVEVLLEVGGDLKLVDAGKQKRLKMSVVGRMAYIERLLEIDNKQGACFTARRYETADATLKVDRGSSQPALRTNRRLIGVSANAQEATVFSPEGALTREELDLIDMPANSAIVDQLLPGRGVQVGDRWQHTNELLAQLLCIDAVNTSDVFSELAEVDREAARFELNGTLAGGIHGVTTDMQLKGRYKFDLAAQRITWLALMIEEQRAIGHVGPGADVTSRLQMTIAPAESPVELNDESVRNGLWNAQQAFTALEYRSGRGGFAITHDRRWHVVDDRPESVAMRLVDRGHLVSQANISSLESPAAGKIITLEKFQADIQQSLGESFGQFVKASEGTTPQGHVVYRISAVGQVSEVPIQWNYYLVASREGRQVVLAFTTEDEQVVRLAETDAAIAESVEFFEPTTAAVPKLTR